LHDASSFLTIVLVSEKVKMKGANNVIAGRKKKERKRAVSVRQRVSPFHRRDEYEIDNRTAGKVQARKHSLLLRVVEREMFA
jgi:hypothetical protein